MNLHIQKKQPQKSIQHFQSCQKPLSRNTSYSLINSTFSKFTNNPRRTTDHPKQNPKNISINTFQLNKTAFKDKTNKSFISPTNNNLSQCYMPSVKNSLQKLNIDGLQNSKFLNEVSKQIEKNAKQKENKPINNKTKDLSVKNLRYFPKKKNVELKKQQPKNLANEFKKILPKLNVCESIQEVYKKLSAQFDCIKTQNNDQKELITVLKLLVGKLENRSKQTIKRKEEQIRQQITKKYKQQLTVKCFQIQENLNKKFEQSTKKQQINIKIMEQQNSQLLSNCTDSSINSYIVQPSTIAPTNNLNQQMKSKLKLNFTKVHQYKLKNC